MWQSRGDALSFFRQHVTTLLTALVTIALSFSSDFLLDLPREITWLTFFVGSIITLAATLVEIRLVEIASSEISRKLEIYGLLEKLEKDDTLRLRAMEIIDTCQAELENLTKGILRLEGGEFYRYVTEKMKTASRYVQAIHVALELSDMYIWESEQGVINYYRVNVEAVQRRVTIERIFVLQKEKVINTANGQIIDLKTIEIMRQQKRDGINVIIVWIESMSENVFGEEFMIFDGKEVQVNHPRLHDRYYNLSIIRKPSDVRSYRNKYSKLRAVGVPIDEFLKSIGQE